MIAKVKLIFYAVVVFSIYLCVIFYSLGDNETNLRDTTTKQIAHSSDESNINKSVTIKLIFIDLSGNPLSESNLIIKNNKNEKDTDQRVQTNVEGEIKLDLIPGSYLIYLEKNLSIQKSVTVNEKDDGEEILVKF